MIFCPHCQEPVSEGSLMCRACSTPINHSEIVAGNLKATQGSEYIVGGINWLGVLLGALIALGLWNGGMYALAMVFGVDALWFGIMVKVTAITAGSMFAGYKSYSAELTHGLLVACLVAAVNGALLVFLIGAELTLTVVLVDFVFIDFGASLFGAFLGAKLQR